MLASCVLIFFNGKSFSSVQCVSVHPYPKTDRQRTSTGAILEQPPRTQPQHTLKPAARSSRTSVFALKMLLPHRSMTAGADRHTSNSGYVPLRTTFPTVDSLIRPAGKGQLRTFYGLGYPHRVLSGGGLDGFIQVEHASLRDALLCAYLQPIVKHIFLW